MDSEMLRKLAAALRKEAAERETEKMIKCGQAMLAAQGLALLKKKVVGHAG